MRGKLIGPIERPKGYVDIDEVYEMLDGVEKEEDCEYGDFGEVLSKWTTCDYGEVLDAISCCNVVQAIPLDRIKQAREEIENLNIYVIEDMPNDIFVSGDDVLAILDKLIAEREE